MSRSYNIVNVSASSLKWSEDYLPIYLQKSKTDQEGDNARTPYCLYDNPRDPSLSVVLLLGIYLYTNPGLLESKRKIFPMDYQYNRHSRIFSGIIKENKVDFARKGVEEARIGSHLVRTGEATHAASGCTCALRMSSIYNRAGWTIGGTRDKYIKFENAGDRFLGRTLEGLN